jgi:sulfur carrier protein
MNLTINGKSVALEPGCRTVSGLLGRPEWNGRLIIVELNGQIVGREAYGDTKLNEGDRIELVHFVGGG